MLIQELKQFPPSAQKLQWGYECGAVQNPLLNPPTATEKGSLWPFVATGIILKAHPEPGFPQFLGWVVQGSAFQTFNVQTPPTECPPRAVKCDFPSASTLSPLLSTLAAARSRSRRSHHTHPHGSPWKPVVWAILIPGAGKGCWKSLPRALRSREARVAGAGRREVKLWGFSAAKFKVSLPFLVEK